MMGLHAARVNAHSGRVCMFVCANAHAPFLSKAPYLGWAWSISIAIHTKHVLALSGPTYGSPLPLLPHAD